MNRIFYIMGKSASGKDKIYRTLLEMDDLDLRPFILYTTRPIRSDEEDGREYYFVDEAVLEQIRAQGRLIEERSYDTVYGVWTYFTADESRVDLKNHSYIGIGTLESYEKMVEYYGEDIMRPIYVEVEDGERLRRALKREGKEPEPKYAEMCRRFLADCEDFSEERILHAGIKRRFLNIDLENCMDEIKQYITDEIQLDK